MVKKFGERALKAIFHRKKFSRPRTFCSEKQWKGILAQYYSSDCIRDSVSPQDLLQIEAGKFVKLPHKAQETMLQALVGKTVAAVVTKVLAYFLLVVHCSF
jgi:hypothetical protein